MSEPPPNVPAPESPDPPPTDGPDHELGRVVGGRYRLVAPVGAGASARVYLARDLTLRRKVAVKCLRPGLSGDRRFLRRFAAEARAAAQLSHPNLLAVYDWGEDGETAYIITEILLGGSMRAMLDREPPLSVSQGLLIALQLAEGLAYAHELGWVHRDIKPANVLFGEEGRLRIADFGIARAVAEASLTEPEGILVGTARYAAPEQAEAAVDGKADVYSLALTVIEAVTGRVPLLRDNPLATLLLRRERDLGTLARLGPLGPPLAAAGRADPTERPTAAELAGWLSRTARLLPPPRRLPLVGSLEALRADRAGEGDTTTVLDLTDDRHRDGVDPDRIGPATARQPAIDDGAGVSYRPIPRPAPLEIVRALPTSGSVPRVRPGADRPVGPADHREDRPTGGDRDHRPGPAGEPDPGSTPATSEVGGRRGRDDVPTSPRPDRPAVDHRPARSPVKGDDPGTEAHDGWSAALAPGSPARLRGLFQNHGAPSGRDGGRVADGTLLPDGDIAEGDHRDPVPLATAGHRAPDGHPSGEPTTVDGADGGRPGGGIPAAGDGRDGAPPDRSADADDLGGGPAAGAARRWWAPALVVLVLAGLAAVVLTGSADDDADEEVVSPPPPAVADLVGRTLTEAEAEAAEHGWTLVTQETRRDGTELGQVLEQDPTPGRQLAPGGELAIVVSLGSELRTVPALVGRNVSEADEILTEAELAVGAVTRRHDELAPEGDVLAVRVEGAEPGIRLETDTPVDLVVSAGPPARPLPSFVGLSEVDAERQADELDLTVSWEDDYSEIYEEGLVIDHEPPTGDPVGRGDDITLVRSLGPPLIVVPDVRGLAPAAAADLLVAEGFVVDDTVGPPNQPVVATVPAAGQVIPKGSTVTVRTIT